MMDYKTRSLAIEQVRKATTKLKQRQTMESGIRVGELSTQIVHICGERLKGGRITPWFVSIEVGII
jgi:hypothetical protein